MRKKIIGLTMGVLFMLPLCVFSQTRSVTGTISDSRGEPIPYATIKLKGTSTATAASETGQFSISVSGTNPVLVISATGYETREVNIGESNSYAIQLTETGALNEVVVTALGISKEKKALGYATQEVKAADLNRNLQPNVLNALQGKVAGVTISS